MTLNYHVYPDNRPVQRELFSPAESRFDPPVGISYIADLLPESKHEPLFRKLSATVRWHTHYSTRETITWGQPGLSRHLIRTRLSWPDFLGPLALAIQNQFGFLPNNCVANHYRTGKQGIGFHSDSPMEWHPGTGIVILSLGAVRHLVLRRIHDPTIRYHYALQPGSGLYLDDASQSVWQHGILPEPGSGPRISLSFRRIAQRGDIRT